MIGHEVLPTDLGAVIDARSRVPACQGSKNELLLLPLAGSTCPPEELKGLVIHEASRPGPFSLVSHPGCIIFPGWLSPQAQIKIASDALQVFPDSPAKTNHSAKFGDLTGLWEAARANKVLERNPSPENQAASMFNWVDMSQRHLDKKGDPRPGVVTAGHLLQSLRWATLGPPYGTPGIQSMKTYLSAASRMFGQQRSHMTPQVNPYALRLSFPARQRPKSHTSQRIFCYMPKLVNLVYVCAV